jgi:hypothetical protein
LRAASIRCNIRLYISIVTILSGFYTIISRRQSGPPRA